MPDSIFYPYQFAESALEISVTGLSTDGRSEEVDEHVDEQHCTINLMSLNGAWKTITLTLSVSDPNSQLDAVQPPSAQSGDCSVWLVVRNPVTRVRDTVRLTPAGEGWNGEVSLERDNTLRYTRLQCFVVLDRDVSAESGFAFRAGERIADSAQWTCYTDILPAMPGGALNSEWVDFEKSRTKYLQDRKDCVWYLDLADAESPRLLLNEAVPGLRQTLEVEGKISKAARARDALIDSILQPVLTELAVYVLSSVDGGEFDELPGWQRMLIERLARTDGRSSEKVLARQWVEAWKSGTDTATVLLEIATAVQRHLNLRHSCEHLSKSIESYLDNGQILPSTG